jgi:hypothetical protein
MALKLGASLSLFVPRSIWKGVKKPNYRHFYSAAMPIHNTAKSVP